MPNEEKYSFLEHLLPNVYGYAKAFKPLAWIYLGVLIIVLILSQLYYSSIIEWFIDMMMGWTVMNILFIGIMIVNFDIKVTPISKEEATHTSKPKRYKFSMVWGCSMFIVGILGLFFSNEYKKDYAFECSDFFLENATGVYHIWGDCPDIGIVEQYYPNVNGESSWVKGYEIEKWHTLCVACKERVEEGTSF